MKVKEAFTSPLAEQHPGERMMNALAAAKLTDEQKTQIKTILADARTKAQAASTPEQKQEIWKAAFEKIKSDVLTAEQRERLGRMPQRQEFLAAIQKLNLTDDQKKQIEQIRQESREKAEKATTPEAKRQAMQEGFKKIFQEVLTDQQRQELAKFRQGPERRGERPTSRPAHAK